jgi:hypothetical protein
MSIVIEKRTRATINDDWGAWASTTDSPPYTNTDTIEYRVSDDVEIEDLVNGSLINNVWTGTGVFDTLVSAVNENIKGEYQQGRLNGTDYATVYLGSMQSVISESIRFLLEKDKATNLVKQGEVLDAQKELYDRQKEAFDDNKYQKLFEAQLNYNGMVFQDADSPDVLDVALENRVNDVFNKITGKDSDISIVPEV